MRTVFNVAQGLCEVLGPAWYHILEVLQAVDRGIRLASAAAGTGTGSGGTGDKAGGVPPPMLDKGLSSSSAVNLNLGSLSSESMAWAPPR